MNELVARAHAAQYVASLDADAVVTAAVELSDPEFLAATAPFIAPPVVLGEAELLAAAAATHQAISEVIARSEAVLQELQQLPRTTPSPADTGTRVDFIS
ncbi:MAG: hypothetical protein ACOYN3_02010 [Acidimicrobiia bacterium]